MAIVYGKHYQSTKGAEGEQVYISFRIDNNGDEKVSNSFARIIDIDSEEVLFLFQGEGKLILGGNSFYWLYPPIFIMPNRTWNLRIETGTGNIVESIFDFTIPLVSFPSNRHMKMSVEQFEATKYVKAGEMIPEVGWVTWYNRGTDICIGKIEIWDMNKGELCCHLFGEPTGMACLSGAMISPINIYRSNKWKGRYLMPNENLHLQARTYHINPVTGEYLDNPDSVMDFIIELMITGKLNVNSTPSGADVYINAGFIGKTPIANYNLGPSNYVLQLFLPGYQDYKTEFTQPNDGSTKDFNITLTPKEEPPVGKAMINVNSTPSNAEVYIDENYIGNAPIEDYEI